MAKAQDINTMMKDMMGAFPVDTKAMEEAFKNQAALSEKLSGVALEAAEEVRPVLQAHVRIDGLYSIVGGKLTTHRALAEDFMRLLRRRLRTLSRSPTVDRDLPGSLSSGDHQELLAELRSHFDEATARRFCVTYGSFSRSVLALGRDNRDWLAPVGPEHDLTTAELVHGIGQEHARTLIDLLQRRTMVGLGADFGLDTAPLAAQALVRAGVWDSARAAAEVEAYRHFARRHAVPPAVT